MVDPIGEQIAAADGIEETGPWPFITRRILCDVRGVRTIWSSRHHRKKLILPELAQAGSVVEKLLRSLWMPRKLNWWIGILFAIGAMLFATGSLLNLAPDLAAAWSLSPLAINAIYFAGSIPFTTAAYLQLFQAANVGPRDKAQTESLTKIRLFNWRPHDVGWLSCALQFIGTIMFNFNTFDAMIPSLSWFEQDLVIWVPNYVGSILFLISGYLAFIEICHDYWAWRPRSISWWIGFANLMGCVGFMASALLSIVLPDGPHEVRATLAIAFTLQGAIGFFIGALLMLPEAADEATS